MIGLGLETPQQTELFNTLEVGEAISFTEKWIYEVVPASNHISDFRKKSNRRIVAGLGVFV